MRVQNKIDRYHLILDILNYVPKLKKVTELKDYCLEMLEKHHEYIREYGKEIKEVSAWKWKD